jgi:hypothetical protein
MPGASLAETVPGGFEAPPTAEEFWKRDWVYIRTLVATLLRDRQETEDVAADIFEKLMVRDVPGMYNPDTVSQHTSRRVPWRSFLSAQVALYVRGKSEQVARRQYREPLLCDSTSDSGVSWLEMFGDSCGDEYPSLEEDFVARVRARLAVLPPWDGVSLADLFEAVLAQAAAGQKVSLAFLRRKFGFSQDEAEAAMVRLREEMGRSDAAVALVEVAGMSFTPAELAAAADLLEAAPGSHVRPALARGGHRLAQAGTRWYLPVAREELALFPELKVASGSHQEGHVSHVKGALVHWLRRASSGAAAGAPAVPEAVRPVTMEERLEARLWQLGASAGDVSEILELARRAYGAPARRKQEAA